MIKSYIIYRGLSIGVGLKLVLAANMSLASATDQQCLANSSAWATKNNDVRMSAGDLRNPCGLASCVVRMSTDVQKLKSIAIRLSKGSKLFCRSEVLQQPSGADPDGCAGPYKKVTFSLISEETSGVFDKRIIIIDFFRFLRRPITQCPNNDTYDGHYRERQWREYDNDLNILSIQELDRIRDPAVISVPTDIPFAVENEAEK